MSHIFLLDTAGRAEKSEIRNSKSETNPKIETKKMRMNLPDSQERTHGVQRVDWWVKTSRGAGCANPCPRASMAKTSSLRGRGSGDWRNGIRFRSVCGFSLQIRRS